MISVRIALVRHSSMSSLLGHNRSGRTRENEIEWPHTEPRKLMKGETIFREGEKPRWMFLVEKGWVKVGMSSPNGKEVAIEIWFPGEFCGVTCGLFDDVYWSLFSQEAGHLPARTCSGLTPSPMGMPWSLHSSSRSLRSCSFRTSNSCVKSSIRSRRLHTTSAPARLTPRSTEVPIRRILKTSLLE